MKTKLITTIGCLLMMAVFVKADAILSFNDGNAIDQGAAGGTYTPGSSFTFDITLTVQNSGSDPVPDVSGLSYWFETSAVNNSYFTITNRNLTGSVFTDPNTPGIVYPQAIVAGGNPNDLGATDGTHPTNASYFVATLTIQISPTTPAGTYTIFTTGFNSNPDHSKTTEANDSGFTHHLISPTAYTITVVPEPATLSLLGLGSLGTLGLTMLRARRKS